MERKKKITEILSRIVDVKDTKTENNKKYEDTETSTLYTPNSMASDSMHGSIMNYSTYIENIVIEEDSMVESVQKWNIQEIKSTETVYLYHLVDIYKRLIKSQEKRLTVSELEYSILAYLLINRRKTNMFKIKLSDKKVTEEIICAAGKELYKQIKCIEATDIIRVSLGFLYLFINKRKTRIKKPLFKISKILNTMRMCITILNSLIEKQKTHPDESIEEILNMKKVSMSNATTHTLITNLLEKAYEKRLLVKEAKIICIQIVDEIILADEWDKIMQIAVKKEDNLDMENSILIEELARRTETMSENAQEFIQWTMQDDAEESQFLTQTQGLECINSKTVVSMSNTYIIEKSIDIWLENECRIAKEIENRCIEIFTKQHKWISKNFLNLADKDFICSIAARKERSFHISTALQRIKQSFSILNNEYMILNRISDLRACINMYILSFKEVEQVISLLQSILDVENTSNKLASIDVFQSEFIKYLPLMKSISCFVPEDQLVYMCYLIHKHEFMEKIESANIHYVYDALVNRTSYLSVMQKYITVKVLENVNKFHVKLEKSQKLAEIRDILKKRIPSPLLNYLLKEDPKKLLDMVIEEMKHIYAKPDHMHKEKETMQNIQLLKSISEYIVSYSPYISPNLLKKYLMSESQRKNSI